MLGAMMFCSKMIMELLPNIHLIGMFCILLTAVFGFKALIPIYLFVGITGVYGDDGSVFDDAENGAE